jgi:cytochrome b pre-mRNA-processing protein 3
VAFPNLKEAIHRLLGHDPQQNAAVDLYTRVVEQARAPAFYEDYAVPDTVDGRFDLLTLHMFLVLGRLKQEGERTRAFAQKLFDVMFRNMDDSLREMGVGDLKVGKEVRALAEGFYGRIGAYDAAMAAGGGDALASALSRNIYEEEAAPLAPRLAAYTQEAAAGLDAQPVERLMAGEAFFPEPRQIAAVAAVTAPPSAPEGDVSDEPQ